jgi:hypothetical protein
VTSPAGVGEDRDDGVVEGQEGALDTADDEVLVVAAFGGDGAAFVVAGQVLELPAGLEPEEDRVVVPVELTVVARAGAVHAVEVERGGAEVAAAAERGDPAQARPGIGGDVVVQELADERRAGGVGGVVRVVRADLGLGDEAGGPDLERVLGVHRPAGGAEGEQRLSQVARGVLSERRQPEEPAELIGVAAPAPATAARRAPTSVAAVAPGAVPGAVPVRCRGDA